MRLARKAMLASLVVVSMLAGGVWAQVLKQVPDNALVVLKVSNLEATNKKVAALFTSLGLVQMNPDLADPWGAIMKNIGVSQGVKMADDFAMAYVDADAYHVPSDKALLMLIPVSDYQQFIGNFADAKTEGDLTTAHFKDDVDLTYVAHWGGYAALSPCQELVAKAPVTPMTVEGMAAKEAQGKDLVILANMKALRAKAMPALEQAQLDAPKAIDDAIAQNPKMQIPGEGEIDAARLGPVAKVAVDQALNLAREFVQDTTAATVGINLSADGIASTTLVEFQPDSSIGKHVAALKNTDASLLAGIPEGKYLIFGGGVCDPKDMAQANADFLAPIQKAIKTLGPDYACMNDLIDAYMKMNQASTGSQFAMVAPSAPPGAGSLVQFLAMRRGDAKASHEAAHAAFDDQMAVMKAIGLQAPMTQKWIPAAKTVDGVAFDEMQGTLVADVNAPMNVQQAQQMMAMVYGPGGPSFYSGMVNDKATLVEIGLYDATITAAISDIQKDADPLAQWPGVKTVAAQLPAKRMVAAYIPLDVWASTGLNYAKLYGMDMGVVLPDNLPPVGVTLSSDGTAMRYDEYVPMQLIQALTAAGIQVFNKMQAPRNPGMAPAPGGL